MKILICLNGIIEDYAFIADAIKKNCIDYIICADGGLKHIHNLNLAADIKLFPDKIMGDFDSVDRESLKFYRDNGSIIETYPKEKDYTDGHLVTLEAIKLNPEEVIIIGGLGGRFDHTLANIHLLDIFLGNSIKAWFLDKNTIIYLIDKNTEFFGKTGDLLSIFPFGGRSEGITLSGLKYKLNDSIMEYGNPYGISNVFLQSCAKVNLKSGKLLIIHDIE
jgi:thiamine pyrophosphokinase